MFKHSKTKPLGHHFRHLQSTVVKPFETIQYYDAFKNRTICELDLSSVRIATAYEGVRKTEILV